MGFPLPGRAVARTPRSVDPLPSPGRAAEAARADVTRGVPAATAPASRSASVAARFDPVSLIEVPPLALGWMPDLSESSAMRVRAPRAFTRSFASLRFEAADEAVLGREERRAGARGDLELPVDVLDVGRDGL